jgi:hypothetical protein
VKQSYNLSAWEYDRIFQCRRSLDFGGLRVVVYPNDHRPAHVHVIGRKCEAVFNLNCPAGPVEVRENYRFSRRELRQIQNALTKRLGDACGAWERIHGIEPRF